MKIYHSPNSPYVRVVMVTAAELGVADRLERIPADVWQANDPITLVNPLGQIPAIISDEGEVIYDSPVICDYLNERFGGGRLLPREGSQRWRILRLRALGNGLMNAAVIRALEMRRRPEALRWDDLVVRQKGVMRRVYDSLEKEAGGFSGAVDLAQITIACALGYVDLRLAEDRWREGRPALSGWYSRMADRPSFMASAPPAVAA